MPTYSNQSRGGYKIQIDTSALDEFNRVLEQYKVFNKKAPAEIINSKLVFIARSATMTTKKTDKATISAGLDKMAEEYPNSPIGAIVAQRDYFKKHGKGLSRNKMQAAWDKLKKVRNRSIGYGRAGWIQAIKLLDNAKRLGDIKFANRFKPKMDTTVKQFGKILGGAEYARNDRLRCWGEIFNSAATLSKHGNKNNFIAILQNGLNDAIKRETASMRVYITRKMEEYYKKTEMKRN